MEILNLVSAWIHCSSRFWELSVVLQQRVLCDSAFPPACAIWCYRLSVSVYGRKLAGTEDLSKQSEESPVKSDQDDNCWWTTGSRRLGPRLRHCFHCAFGPPSVAFPTCGARPHRAAVRSIPFGFGAGTPSGGSGVDPGSMY